MVPVNEVSTFPWPSSALTTKPNAVPAVTLLGGCVVITNLSYTLNVAVVTEGNPLLVAINV